MSEKEKPVRVIFHGPKELADWLSWRAREEDRSRDQWLRLQLLGMMARDKEYKKDAAR